MITFFVPLVVLTGGLAAGGLMISALGGAPMLLALPVNTYLPVHKLLVGRFDPFMPVCIITSLLSDIALAVVAPNGATHTLAAAGAALYLSVLSVSLTKNVPINRWIKTLDPANPPADWNRIDPRVRWRNWNLVRTVLALLALVVNVAAVGVLV
jgi:uncharacterized membrane protein